MVLPLTLGQEYETEKGTRLKVIRLRTDGVAVKAVGRGLDKDGNFTQQFWGLYTHPTLGPRVVGPLLVLEGEGA